MTDTRPEPVKAGEMQERQAGTGLAGVDPVSADPWRALAALSPARIALGRAGSGLPTAAALEFSLAHAMARDAVHAALDVSRVCAEIEHLGLGAYAVASAAGGRDTYLLRPDLGRRLAPSGRSVLDDLSGFGLERCPDLVIVVADGLSSTAVHHHAVALIGALHPLVEEAGLSLAPVIVAEQARVALGDEIGERLKAHCVAVLIGERPGLSAPDSLGVYLTYAPKVGRTDAERNCISNIHAAGLTHQAAAHKLAWLLQHAFARGETGVGLKDESDLSLLDDGATAAIES